MSLVIIRIFEGETVSAVTVTYDRYVHVVSEFLLPELRRHDVDLTTCWFQQDGATTRTAGQSMNTFKTGFEHRIIYHYGDISWPALSVDLSACDLFP